MMMLRRLLVLGLAALVIPACHNDGSSGSGAGSGNGAPVALFLNPAYVDYIPGDDGSEGNNLEYALPALGYSNLVFSGITDADFAAVLTKRTRALVIPELEDGDLFPDLSDSAQDVIRTYVQRGGLLIGFLSSTDFLNVVNGIFGFSIDAPNSLGTAAITPAAGGTPFAGGPATLPYNDDTSVMDPASLPAGALTIYADDNTGEPALVVIPFGQGHIVIFGYDWYDGAPFGVQDGGWLEVLGRALNLGR